MAAGARRPWRLGAGVPRRRRARRADHDDHLVGLDRGRRRRARRRRLDPTRFGDRARRAPARSRAATAPTTRRPSATCSPAADRERCATRSCSTPPPRSPRSTGSATDGLRAGPRASTTRSRAGIDDGRARDRPTAGPASCCANGRGQPARPSGNRAVAAGAHTGDVADPDAAERASAPAGRRLVGDRRRGARRARDRRRCTTSASRRTRRDRRRRCTCRVRSTAAVRARCTSRCSASALITAWQLDAVATAVLVVLAAAYLTARLPGAAAIGRAALADRCGRPRSSPVSRSARSRPTAASRSMTRCCSRPTCSATWPW